MRRAFDAILSGAVAAQERAAALVAQAGSLQPGDAFDVISFENGLPIAPRWRILDDVVSFRAEALGNWDAVLPSVGLGMHGRGPRAEGSPLTSYEWTHAVKCHTDPDAWFAARAARWLQIMGGMSQVGVV